MLSNSWVLKFEMLLYVSQFSYAWVFCVYIHYRTEASDFTVSWGICGARKEEHSRSRTEGLKTTREAAIRHDSCNFSHLPFSQSYVRKNILMLPFLISIKKKRGMGRNKGVKEKVKAKKGKQRMILQIYIRVTMHRDRFIFK